jgi:hypothetical protein
MSTQTVTITPKYVNPPKEGKKYGSLKTDDGVQYAAPPSVTSACEPGVPVTIEWEGQTWGGNPVMVVRRVVGAQHGHNGGAHPHPQPNGNGRHSAAGGDAKAREMFIMGVVGRAMGSGQFEASHIYDLTAAAAKAWDAVLNGAGHPEQTRGYSRRDLDDEIPF